MQFGGSILRRSGHAAQARVAAKESLQRDRPENAPVRTPLEAFLGFQRRLQTVGPMTIRDHTSGELIDNLDPAAANDVVDVASQEDASVQRTVQFGEQRNVVPRVKGAAAQNLLDVLGAPLGQLDVPPVLVGVEMNAGRQGGDHSGQPRRTRILAPDASGNH